MNLDRKDKLIEIFGMTGAWIIVALLILAFAVLLHWGWFLGEWIVGKGK